MGPSDLLNQITRSEEMFYEYRGALVGLSDLLNQITRS